MKAGDSIEIEKTDNGYVVYFNKYDEQENRKVMVFTDIIDVVDFVKGVLVNEA